MEDSAKGVDKEPVDADEGSAVTRERSNSINSTL